MEITGPMDLLAMQTEKIAVSKDIAMLKKANDVEKDMATQLLEALPSVDYSAPPGQQVRMFA